MPEAKYFCFKCDTENPCKLTYKFDGETEEDDYSPPYKCPMSEDEPDWMSLWNMRIIASFIGENDD